MVYRYDGKVAFISGAGGKKGLALTKLLTTEGAIVFISDVDERKVKDNADELNLGDRVRPLKLDVGLEADWKAAMAAVESGCGRLDVLFHTARVFGPGDLLEMEFEDWRSSLAVNLDGAFLAAKHAIPIMIRQGGGAIVNILSASALRPVEGLAPYGACNAGAFNLTKSIAITYGRQNIRANAVICGFSTNSPMEDTQESARRLVPLGRPALPEDIARAAAWLGCDESAYCNGSAILLDGGLTVGLRLD